ncbi:MAG: hypothetical protein YK1312THETA_50002 [Marine Group I thaumarchaeote]|nr:MAG: hypothetical protein YK1312THETA_50002 [Marine Group I thaumarchaeote]
MKELVRKSSVLFELHMVSAVSISFKLLMTHNLPKDYYNNNRDAFRPYYHNNYNDFRVVIDTAQNN